MRPAPSARAPAAAGPSMECRGSQTTGVPSRPSAADIASWWGLSSSSTASVATWSGVYRSFITWPGP